jgi:rhamnosyltransferase
MTMGATVSVVLPVLNGMATLPLLFDAMAAQSRAPQEIVAVDSGSRDGTPEFLRNRGVSVVEIPPASFNHGETRNLAIRRTRGDLIVLLVQDAIPIGEHWLEALARPFETNVRLAGTFARQVPCDDATALTRRSLEGWLASGGEGRTIGPLSREAFDALTPAERHAACVFDNVCSCVRRTAWERHPFRAVPIAEDLEWARDVLLDGWRLQYVPAAAVRHSHERGVVYEWRRTYLVHHRLQALFGLTTIPTVSALVKAIARTLPAHLRAAAKDAGFPRAVGLAFAWPAAQYMGARDARGGRPARSMRGV